VFVNTSPLGWLASGNALPIGISYLQHALLLLALLTAWRSLRRPWIHLTPSARLGFWALAACMALWAAWFTRGWLGELSLLTTVWAAWAVHAFHNCRSNKSLGTPAAAVLGVVGLVLYPSALHLVQLDLYAWGYFSPFAYGVLAFAAIAWAAKQQLWASAMVVGTALWALGFRHSTNLWDMLFDVPLWLIALFTLVQRVRPSAKAPKGSKP
jgi:hypothetical protein